MHLFQYKHTCSSTAAVGLRRGQPRSCAELPCACWKYLVLLYYHPYPPKEKQKKEERRTSARLAAAELGEKFREGVGAAGGRGEQSLPATACSWLCMLGFVRGEGFYVIIAYAD